MINLTVVDDLEDARIRSLLLLGLQLLLNVARVHRLDHLDTDRQEIAPVNELILVLVGHTDQHVHIVVVEPVRQCVERVTELGV